MFGSYIDIRVDFCCCGGMYRIINVIDKILLLKLGLLVGIFSYSLDIDIFWKEINNFLYCILVFFENV